MRCTYCQAYVSSTAFTCPQCSLPIQTSTVVLSSDKPGLRKDITWLVWFFLSTSLLILSVASVWGDVADVPKMEGEAVAPGVMAAGIAWLFGRLWNARFRLSMAVAYSFLVGVLLVGRFSSTVNINSSSPQQAAYEIQWPVGWQVRKQPIPSEEGLAGEIVTAEKFENSAPVAVIVLIVAEKNAQNSTLQDDLRRMIESERQTAEQNGSEWSSSLPVEGKVGGRPSLEVESHIKKGGADVRQFIALTHGEKNACTVNFTARDNNYERLQSELRQAHDSLICY